MIANLVKYLVIGICAIFAFKIAIAAIGVAFGLAIVAVPAVLIGWVAYKLLGGGKKSSEQISEADRKWLES
ncbi:MAG: hypothetical protein ACREMA_03340 [Longimicrobiales bacterium]